jgi:class 3 adenylate cyclase
VQRKSLIAVCDILGFSHLVESAELDAVVQNAMGWFRRALHHSIHKGEFPTGVPSLRALEAHPHVGVAWFSDTVLLYTKEDSNDAVRELLTVVAWLLFETTMQGLTRIRAGISYGEVFLDPENSLYVGMPIVEAYRLEQKQQWSGAALAPSAEHRIPAEARTGRFADWRLTPYAVPLKGGTQVQALAVNWNQGIHALGWRFLWSSKSAEPTPDDWAANPDVCEKFINTRAFHEAHCQECRAAREA